VPTVRFLGQFALVTNRDLSFANTFPAMLLREFQVGEFAPVTACYHLASVNSTASLLIVPFEIAMSLPSGEKR